MRAALITAYGAPPETGEHPAPTPGDGQALVRPTVAPIIPLDVLCATGTSYFGAPPLPYVPGVQGVGVVLASATVPEGTRVWFPTTAGMAPGNGSLGQRVVVPDDDLVTVPDGVEDALVAALGLSAVAARMALAKGRTRDGDQVMVLGAGGVVGQVAVQVARLLGARRVVAVCRSRLAQERARQRGADAVVVLHDGDAPDALAERMADACDGPVDVTVDPLCGVPASAALQVLGNRGRHVNLGSSAGPTAEFSSARLRSTSASVLGYTNNELTSDQRRQTLQELLDHARHGRLTVAYERVPLDEVTSAWARQAQGLADRRLVVTVPAD